MKTMYRPAQEMEERAILVQVTTPRERREEAEESIHELERLADTAGVTVVGVITQRLASPTKAFLVGEGKLAEIQLACRHADANVVIVDNDLSAIQVNNLDLSMGIRVIDRTELILQIFARRASSSESQTQVELAQLEYLVKRIPVSSKQQRFQGGIGMRGPGESPLQLRNAPMRRRIKDLKVKLEAIRSQRKRTRRRNTWPMVSLVGYTNAGKSTLLNALSGADAYIDDRLFATLDTKTRLVYLDEKRQILLSDTVGFIRNLPHGLVASFRSTLDVAAESDVLLIVVDAGHAHVADHLAVVASTLREIKANRVPTLTVLNKWDCVTDPARQAALLAQLPESIPISARTGEGLDRLKAAIMQSLT